MSREFSMLPSQIETPMSMEGMAARAIEAATLLGAMASPVRLLILCSLVDGEKPVHELVANSGITQGAVSQHLAKMRSLKLVSTRRDGQIIYYTLASDDVKQLLSTLHSIFCKDVKSKT
jgi:ArsR family transcriptional regulator, virulence genes transcriptional regulator